MTPRPLASIHFTGRNYIFASVASRAQQPGEFSTLDEAIRGAHSAGFDVASVFVNAGLSLNDASAALLVARRLIEDAEDSERDAPPVASTALAKVASAATEWRSLDVSEPIGSPVPNQKLLELALAVDELKGAPKSESAAPPAAETLERWAVRVLDAWIDLPSRGGSWRVTRNDAVSKTENEFMVELVEDDAEEDPPIFLGPAPDAARIAAARALSASDPSLPKEPGT